MPITLTCTGCGSSYQLKDEFAGRKLRCPGCNSVQTAPEASDDLADEAGWDDSAGDSGGLPSVFRHDKFLLRQKMMTVGSKYLVWDEEQRPLLFVERSLHFWRQVLGAVAALFIALVVALVFVMISINLSGPASGAMAFGGIILAILAALFTAIRLSPKRHIYFYTDESRAELLLQVLQDQKVAIITATYTLLGPQGELIARMRKNYLYNLFRKRWDVFGPQGETILIAREDSLILSLMRRFLGVFFGMLRTNYILVTPEAGREERLRGEFLRKFTLFDRYVLDMTRDRPATIDRRVAVAMGVLLDTGEHR